MDTRTLRHPGALGAPVPRWTLVAGWASLLLPLPSILWRIAMLAGLDVGFRDAELYRGSVEAVLYVVGLEAVQILVAVLCFGLIRPWSEVLPRWVPAVGGRTIHRLVPTAVGAVGALALWATLLPLIVALVRTWSGVAEGWTPDIGMSSGERGLLLVAYIPFFLWPIAVSVAVAGYWVRRSPRRALTANTGARLTGSHLTGRTRTTASARRPSSAQG
ncbi:MAG TPA: hypothetical protein VK039_06275 [Brevibacterium sp.]|nr:hypothetical protein [Brevibacterium sp.]